VKPWHEASSSEYASVSTITPERYLFFEIRLIKKHPIKFGATTCECLEKNSFLRNEIALLFIYNLYY
tara:strand:- start:108 stop:308 length:201 start_codon:yes stop_codon:yes gene_type:complete